MSYDPQTMIYGVAGMPDGMPLSPYTSMAAPRQLPAQAAYDQSMNMSSLMPDQTAPQMPNLPLPQASQMPMQQPMQQAPQNPIMQEIMSQLVDTMRQKQDQNGLVQQIMAQRMQPNMQDVQQTSYMRAMNPTQAVTPDQVMASRLKSQLTPYADAATIAKTMQENKFAPYTAYASLLNADTASQGGPTGMIMNRLMQSNPGIAGDPTKALSVYKGLAGKGIGYDANGNAINLAGTLGAEQAQSQANASGHELGTEGAKAAMTLPSVQANAQQQIDLIDKIKSDPALQYYTGLGSAIPPIPGTGLARIDAMAKQVLGKNFMTAYESLKGGGSITEIEGQKATEAIARMSRAQKTSDYVAALNDLQSVIKAGVQRSQQKASMANPGQSQSSGATHVYDPNTGQVDAVQ